MKNEIELKCVCGKCFLRPKSKLKADSVYYCSKECHIKSSERSDNTYRCGKCLLWLDKKDFKWIADERYSAGIRRTAYCNLCSKISIQKYRDLHQEKVRQQHISWRERSVSAGGDTALRWCFTRNLGSYKKRSKTEGVPFNLTADYLLNLFHSQNGKCYYTDEMLNWNSVGKKRVDRNSMSLDRLEPKLGYTQGNVVLCFMYVNTAKGGLSENGFYEFCNKVLILSKQRQPSS